VSDEASGQSPGPDIGVVGLDVVGIGADGWAGLTDRSRDVLGRAEVVIGGARQLELLDKSIPAVRELLPTPLVPALAELLQSHAGRRVAVLASGDPMFFGIAKTVLAIRGRGSVRVHAHPSSLSLAAARLAWPLEDVDVCSTVGRPLEGLHPFIQPGRRVLVLVARPDGADRVRALLAARGYGGSAVTVLAQLGGPGEQITSSAGEHDPLAIVAVECVADVATVVLPRTPGLPDDAFDHDGQLTKREIRALTLAALGPVPGQLLWDIGAGSGSIGIEWMRTHPASRAIAVESRADRLARIAENARSLGVPGLQIVAGSAPDALAGLPTPDAVFVGGAVSVPGVVEAGHAALPIGGRLVANAVTVETEVVLAGWHARLGGTLTRIMVQRAEPVGGFTGWRPAMPVTQWALRKETS
jgi:precorrin-6B C5,15-methyltransferase / cobalt-precorrin-6B C5,C15-methyltransferase